MGTRNGVIARIVLAGAAASASFIAHTEASAESTLPQFINDRLPTAVVETFPPGGLKLTDLATAWHQEQIRAPPGDTHH